MTGQPSCKQRVRQHWNSRKRDFALYMANSEVYENGNDDIGPFHEYGLCFDYVAAGTFTDQRKGFWRYQLSTGGPGDELRFYGDAAAKVYKVEYWFLDWYDGARINVTDTPEAQWLVEFFDDVGSFKATLEEAEEAA
jgi:hypothetical protein